ncbi:(4Fe-4S) cluster-binding oxidoreductase [Psychroflexus gondwanensis ACAM 44]|uniref:(4Fe-4S) cluster-binding oxidoreductase n=1 Tax=Psychroflexus gondwanensis ACAM 44 TaxID=1189619 RepID=N1WW96_9FLAO|nr:4Fe-4S dicluster domain-containing protein [Psychroflexus gondwanensis]EMY81394.1 (4Fe-4S) cluster-binding oxidoreductase [Psychroflexus gondwanensis ACAM 44]
MIEYIPQFIFVIVLVGATLFFVKNVSSLKQNINLGKDVDRKDHKGLRFKKMMKIALGQSKMVVRPVAGILHIIVYVGFIIINIEVLEIIIDGVAGTHRIFSFLGPVYDVLIGSFEILAFLVLVSVILFWTRRNVMNIKRFLSKELKGWPKNDANYILYFEVVLMVLFLTMNATDYQLQMLGAPHYASEAGISGAFPISQFLLPLFDGMSVGTLVVIERSAWWLHIVGILIFLNYLYYSKHLHILLAFPNVYFSNLENLGKFKNLEAVTNEVKLMMDPNADPFAEPEGGENEEDIPEKFGASDVQDLNWFQLLSAYTCTECGRCTAECPASQTGKKLSPRKIMMDTRDRLEEVGKQLDKGEEINDDKQLLDGYISREELWACTTCNACVDACPIGIDPLSIIMDMRQYLVMEQSAAPVELNNAMTNIENNSAPWPYNQQDRLDWAKD